MRPYGCHELTVGVAQAVGQHLRIIEIGHDVLETLSEARQMFVLWGQRRLDRVGGLLQAEDLCRVADAELHKGFHGPLIGSPR